MEGGVQCKWHSIEVSHTSDGSKGAFTRQLGLSLYWSFGLIVKVSFCMLSGHLIFLIKMVDISWQCLLAANKAELLILLIAA